MKKLFLLMALALTLTQFDAIAHGVQSPQPRSEMPAQCSDCDSFG